MVTQKQRMTFRVLLSMPQSPVLGSPTMGAVFLVPTEPILQHPNWPSSKEEIHLLNDGLVAVAVVVAVVVVVVAAAAAAAAAD